VVNIAGNDITIIMTIVTIFVLVGTILPFVNSDFSQTSTGTYDVDGFERDIGQELDSEGIEDVDDVSPVKVILSVLSMFFWTFGALPFWLDLIFLIMRIELIITIARNVWIGGGG